MRLPLLCLFILTLLVWSRPGSAEQQGAPESTPPLAPASASATPPSDMALKIPSETPEPLPDNVAATVNGEEVSIDEYYRALVERIGDTALDFLVTQEVVEQELRAQNLDVDNEAVRGRLDAIQAQIAPTSLDDYIRSTGLTRPLFDSVVRSGLGTETLMRADKGIPPDAPFPLDLDPEAWFRENLLPKAKIERPKQTSAGGVAATVNGKPIPTDLWLFYCRELAPDSNEAQLLQQLIDAKIVRQQLQKAGMAISEEDAEREIEIQEKFFNEDPRWHGLTFDKYLSVQGQTRESLKNSEAFLSSLAVQRLIESELSEEEIREYFEKEKERLGEALVHARHILIQAADPETREPNYEQALSKIEQLRSQIENGADFATVAAAESEDVATRPRGGDLGYFPKRQMVEPFANAAFSLEKDGLSEPVKTKFGYHLIQVIDIIPARDLTFEEVRERIVREMVAQRRQAWMLSLRMTSDIRKNDALFGPATQ